MGILDMNESSVCGIVKYYPNLLSIIVLSALLCKKDPIAQVVNKGSDHHV